MTTRTWCLLLLTVVAAACDRSDTPAKAESAEETVREWTPNQRATLHMVQASVAHAFDRASSSALRKVETDARDETRATPDDLLGPETKKMTIFFSANNRAERLDCGCRKNPLGGLARRHTMWQALQDEKGAADVWGDLGPAVGPSFYVDAGDTFFKSATLDRAAPDAQKVVRHDADSVLAAMNTFPPDAMLAGELDFVFGLDTLQKLAGKAKFPILSANVKTTDGEAPFPGSVVIERGGQKVGVIGVTKKETRLGDYWSSRDLTVEAPVDALRRELQALPADVDAVVLLSNMGLRDTGEMLGDLGDERGKLALAVASGTNRLTGDPEYANGVPIVEPLSRGKYVGRADLFLNGDSIDYRNAAGATPAALRDYRRAVRSYWTTRKQLSRHRKQLALLEAQNQNVEPEVVEGKSSEATRRLIERRKDSMESREKRIHTMETRLATVSESLQEAVAQLSPPEKSAGDDWLVSSVVPVKIEFEREPSTKRVVDRNEKRRPEQEAARPRGPGSHGMKKQMRNRGADKQKATGTPAMPEE